MSRDYGHRRRAVTNAAAPEYVADGFVSAMIPACPRQSTLDSVAPRATGSARTETSVAATAAD
jgi:hypothetical protein